MTCARCAEGGKSGWRKRGGRLRCMRAGRVSAMAQVAGTTRSNGGQEKRGREISRERGTRGNESRAKVLSLQTWQSSRKSQNPPTISRSTSPRHGKMTSVWVYAHTYVQYVYMYMRLRDRGVLHASEFASEGPASPALVAYSSVLGDAETRILTRARACVLR